MCMSGLSLLVRVNFVYILISLNPNLAKSTISSYSFPCFFFDNISRYSYVRDWFKSKAFAWVRNEHQKPVCINKDPVCLLVVDLNRTTMTGRRWIVEVHADGRDVVHCNARSFTFPCTSCMFHQPFSWLFPYWGRRNNLHSFFIGDDIPNLCQKQMTQNTG